MSENVKSETSVSLLLRREVVLVRAHGTRNANRRVGRAVQAGSAAH